LAFDRSDGKDGAQDGAFTEPAPELPPRSYEPDSFSFITGSRPLITDETPRMAEGASIEEHRTG
jgi:hypothetical protein